MKKIFLFIFIFSLSLSSFVQAQTSKTKIMWFDATANWQRFVFKDSIRYYINKVKACGFTDIVVDVKPITGEVLFESKIAPVLTEWNKLTMPKKFDYLGYFIEAGHQAGLKVHASLNTFVGGHNYFDRGIVYNDNNKKSWVSLNYNNKGFVRLTEIKSKYSAMLNPCRKDVQDYEISIFKELVKKYPKLDGIILDRVRYDGIEADFSKESKKAFEKFLGQTIKNFPEDIYKLEKTSDTLKVIRTEGKLYKKWLEWRASVIYNFINRAKAEVKKVNPKISFGDYTGAWYPTYFEVGVNWASSKYDPSKDYDWASENYKNFGYAESLDLFTTGNYFYEVSISELDTSTAKTNGEAGMHLGKEYWYSVEGSCKLVKNLLKGKHFYAGLYVDQYKTNKEQFKKAIQMCLKESDGLMVFDIVHIINNNWWDAVILN